VSEPSIREQSLNYRKGVVLGLTLAEIMLLVLFVIMLVLGKLLVDAIDDKKKHQQRLDTLKIENVELVETLQYIQRRVSSNTQIRDIFRELVRKANDYQQVQADLAELTEIHQKFINTLKDVGIDTKTLQGMEIQIEELNDLAKLGEKLIEAEATAGERRGYDKIFQHYQELAATNSNLKGQLENLRRQIESEGSGIGYPPCWVTEDGKPEYIFDIMLTDAGMIVVDNKLPHRKAEQARLPINRIRFDYEISQSVFLLDTLPIFQWSIEKECRYYVRIKDATSPLNKYAYKQHRQAIEDRFYIYIARQT
jgi:hypothetical protein